jgi:hypothetical protein
MEGRISTFAFTGTAIGALLFVFPVLSLTSRFGVTDMSVLGGQASRQSITQIPYLDVYDVLLHTIWYVDKAGHTLGQKSVAILLFFIPRAYWSAKPRVGALDISHELFARKLVGTDNLSMPISGDFYLDFGFIGVALGALVIGILFRFMFIKSRQTVFNQRVFDYILLAQLPILYRGPVGAVAPLFVCALASYLVLCRPIRSRRRASVGTTPDPNLTATAPPIQIALLR